jgi:hypothetical protein
MSTGTADWECSKPRITPACETRESFVARWCAMQRVEIVDGVDQVRNDEPTPPVGAAVHKTP